MQSEGKKTQTESAWEEFMRALEAFKASNDRKCDEIFKRRFPTTPEG